MSFTRFHDDPVRIEKRLQIATNAGRYALTAPGPGINIPFIADPHYRLEKWGGNYLKNAIGIEDDLHGLTRRNGHDEINSNDYTKHTPYTARNIAPINKDVLVEESRAVLPAFLFREATMFRWETPFIDPQANLEIPFNNNIQSRITEKDSWTDNYLLHK